ncbi:hypothetical protein SDC9_206377 [bioreactor metagenome]|uniref:Uncharacterized protein n=1 Tax=bioreactor metagenome TaxID=1076179 RepID=A0A645J5D6_9ZZZZ
MVHLDKNIVDAILQQFSVISQLTAKIKKHVHIVIIQAIESFNAACLILLKKEG